MLMQALSPRSFQRLYKSGKNDDMHKYTLHGDDPDFLRAKLNAQQISNVRLGNNNNFLLQK